MTEQEVPTINKNELDILEYLVENQDMPINIFQEWAPADLDMHPDTAAESLHWLVKEFYVFPKSTGYFTPTNENTFLTPMPNPFVDVSIPEE